MTLQWTLTVPSTEPDPFSQKLSGERYLSRARWSGMGHNSAMERYHPWRQLRDHHPDVSVTCRYVLPGNLKGAWTRHGIYLHRDLDQAGRRSTLAHELVHKERGSLCRRTINSRMSAAELREEQAVDEIAARRLIPIDDLVDALAWCRWEVTAETAGELWCDLAMLVVRVQTLTIAERRYINEEVSRRQP